MFAKHYHQYNVGEDPVLFTPDDALHKQVNHGISGRLREMRALLAWESSRSGGQG